MTTLSNIETFSGDRAWLEASNRAKYLAETCEVALISFSEVDELVYSVETNYSVPCDDWDPDVARFEAWIDAKECIADVMGYDPERQAAVWCRGDYYEVI